MVYYYPKNQQYAFLGTYEWLSETFRENMGTNYWENVAVGVQ